MQDKNKVTLYLPPELHRQLKIRAAVEAEPMSAIAERAIVFYLAHPGVVDEVETSHGQVHQVYSCPGCESPLVVREGEMVALKEQSALLADEELPVKVAVSSTSDQQGEQALVLAK
jgi:hypothetical protein